MYAHLIARLEAMNRDRDAIAAEIRNEAIRRGIDSNAQDALYRAWNCLGCSFHDAIAYLKAAEE